MSFQKPFVEDLLKRCMYLLGFVYIILKCFKFMLSYKRQRILLCYFLQIFPHYTFGIELDLPQVVLSQEEKETEREACERASRYERSEAREASTTCFAGRKSNRVTSLWREASCCFPHELVFQRIRRLTKMNYFLCFVSSYDDLTHLSQL